MDHNAFSVPVSLIFAAAIAAQAPDDPAVLKLRMLRELDRDIDAACANAHLQARLMLDRVLPIAFLGMVAEGKGEALTVTQIYRTSAAAVAGLRQGDVLRELAGVKLATKEQLYREIRRHRPGEVVELRIARDGKEEVLHPRLGVRWQEDEEDAEQYGDIVPETFTGHGLPAVFDFEKAAAGTAAPGFDQVLCGFGAAPDYVVARVEDHGVLVQRANDDTGIRFPTALVGGVDVDDVVGRIRFRLVGGAQDRAAGIVLRYQDPMNYLVARVNAVEGDLRVFRTVNGLRRTLPGGVATIALDDDRWQELEFAIDGPKVTTKLDGAAMTTSYDTWFAHGRVGIWTKSDSVTEFDEVAFTSPARGAVR